MKPKIVNWEIYHKNFEILGESIMHAGGNPFKVLKDNEDFMRMLANNHIEIGSCVKHNPDLSNE
jgi:hypothetical protein